MAQSGSSSRLVGIVAFLVIGCIIYYKYNQDPSEVVSGIDKLQKGNDKSQKGSLGSLGMSKWEEIKKAALANKALRVTDGKVDIGGKGTAFRREVVDTTLTKPKGILVFLHGMKFRSQTWLDLGTLHVMAAYGYRTIAVDLPGFGNTAVIAGMDSVSFMTEFLKTVLANKPDAVIVISPSMSGSFSLPFLMKHPERFTAFVPVAPVETENYKAEDYKKIQVSTLIIYGSNDTSLGEKSLANLKNLPKSEIFKLEDAGHACYMDQPLIFHKRLKDFLNKIYKPEV